MAGMGHRDGHRDGHGDGHGDGYRNGPQAFASTLRAVDTLVNWAGQRVGVAYYDNAIDMFAVYRGTLNVGDAQGMQLVGGSE